MSANCTSTEVSHIDGNLSIREIRNPIDGTFQRIVGVNHGDLAVGENLINFLKSDTPDKEQAIRNWLNSEPSIAETARARLAAQQYMANASESFTELQIEGSPRDLATYRSQGRQNFIELTSLAHREITDPELRETLMGYASHGLAQAVLVGEIPNRPAQLLDQNSKAETDRLIREIPNRTSAGLIASNLEAAINTGNLGLSYGSLSDLNEVAHRFRDGVYTDQDGQRLSEILSSISSLEVQVLAAAHYFLQRGDSLNDAITLAIASAAHEYREEEMATRISEAWPNQALAVIGVGHTERLNNRLLEICNSTEGNPNESTGLTLLEQTFTEPLQSTSGLHQTAITPSEN